MLVAMRAAGIAAPEAVLAELVTPATEAAVAEARHTVATAVGARHGMIDWEKKNTHQYQNSCVRVMLYSHELFYFHIFIFMFTLCKCK